MRKINDRINAIEKIEEKYFFFKINKRKMWHWKKGKRWN